MDNELSKPVHIVELAKAKKVMKVYSVIGNIFLGVVCLAFVAGVLAILWWVFAENLMALLIIVGIFLAAFLLHLAVSYYYYHNNIIERAETNGTVDD